MHPDDFRRTAHALVDWMADYLAHTDRWPVVPDVRPGAIRRQFPASPPEAPEPVEAILRDVHERIVPGMTHWGHPGFFAYFSAAQSPDSILAEMLTATLGAQCMSWQTSPAATELEQLAMSWLRQMVGLPEAFTGVIQDTASTGTLVAVITARERARERHGAGAPLAVYASRERHSSIDKAVRLAGLGADALRVVPVDACLALRPDALRDAIARDVAAGVVPACVVATIGTTGTTAVDPVGEVAAIARDAGAWLHVDAAYAGNAAVVPELRHHFAGWEHADSVLFNPHKWMLVNFDCTAYYVRDVDALLRTFAASPEYLRTAHDAEVVNYRDWGIQLGRRFRALKLWWVIRSHGVEGIRAMIRAHCAWAAEFASWVAADDRCELVAPVPFSLVCFRLTAGDDATRALLQRLNATGRVFLTHTVVDGRYTIRLAVGARATERRHVEDVWRLIQSSL